MITDTDKLCGDVFTTTSALRYLATAELVGLADMDPVSAGLRDTLCALIDRNQELVERLVLHVEAMERERRIAA